MTMRLDKTEVFRHLDPYRMRIEEGICLDLKEYFGFNTPLKEACAYSLLNGGKRFRPSIVLMVGESLGKGCDVLDAALAVEYFHTASLIADDLPCMDDAAVRRNKPSLHKAFDEATALLASYALISAGYRLIKQNGSKRGDLTLLALDIAIFNTGIEGATGGQYLDLFPPDFDEDTLKEILNKKTVTLFEIAFSLGWLFGGGDVSKLALVKKLAYHFGMAFQIADDLDDLAQDEHSINLAKAIGVDRAIEVLQKEKSSLLLLARELSLDSKEFLSMVSSIN